MFVEAGEARVSERGQMSLPAAARHRWHLAAGGGVAWFDLGDAIVLLPGTVEDARRSLLDQLGEEDWSRARAGFGDPDLANE